MNLNCKQLGAPVLLLAALGMACGPTVAGSDERATVERRLAAMGTSLAITVVAPTRAEGLTASEVAVRAVEAVEARLSTWRSDSELSRVNAAPVGQAVPLSTELEHDLARAQKLWQRTAGHFDPALGALVRAWDLRGHGRVPNATEREEAARQSGWRHYTLAEGHLTRSSEKAQLEEGGFGKGIALDAALAAVDDSIVSTFALELGGQWIVRSGIGQSFPIGIAHPDERMQSILELDLTEGSVATSGNSERSISVDGVTYGHIIDGTHGGPAPDFGSVTVLAADATSADALSTALYVMGPEAALAWAANENNLEIVVVERTGALPRVRATSGLRQRLTPLLTGLEIEFTPHRIAGAQE